jgi:signal transduction histidine kinase
MKTTSKLNKQIFLAMAIAGIFPLLVMAFQNNYFARQTIETIEKEHLSFSLRSRLLWLRTWVSHTRQDFYHIAFESHAREAISDEDAFISAAQKLFKGHVTYRSISLYRPDWSLLIRYPEGFTETVHAPSKSYRKKLEIPGELFVVGEDYRNANNEVILPMGQGLLNRKGELGAYLVAEINLNRSLEKILGDTSDLDEGGRYVLVTKKGKILFQSPVVGQVPVSESCSENMLPPQLLKNPPWQVQKQTNCMNNKIYSINATIPEFEWMLIGQFSAGSKSLQQFRKYVLYGLVTVFCTLFILVILAKNLSKRLAAPLNKLTKVARKISNGQYNERLPPFQEPYAQEVGVAFNSMMDALEKQQQSMVQSTTLSTVGKMSSSLVHEMRNPLSSIKINLQALSRKVKDEEGYNEMANISLLQVGRLESMFDDLLQFSKPIEIHREACTFAEIVSEVMISVMSEAEKKNIELKVDDKLQDFLFMADRENSCRALTNLVCNAIQWSQQDSVVTITAKRPVGNGGVVIICVKDQGPGLRPEQMEKVFQPFFTTREMGTGLGLANVKKVMDYQGGSVLAINNADRGASFSLIFKD